MTEHMEMIIKREREREREMELNNELTLLRQGSRKL
jgi:hypothetical protein